MQRSPRTVKDKDLDYQLNFIFDNAFGNPIILNNVPTADQMKANTWGVYGTYLYVKFGNNIFLRFTGTVIS